MLDTLERMSQDPQDKVFQLFLTILGVLEAMVGVAGAALIYAQAGCTRGCTGARVHGIIVNE